MSIRPPIPDDLTFVNKVLAANGLPHWSQGRYDDFSADVRERNMLIDEGVGFACGGLVAGSKTDALSSHMLRLPLNPPDPKALLDWHRQMFVAMLERHKKKLPGVSRIHVKLARQAAATCIQPALLQGTSGVISYDDSGASLDFIIDAEKVLEWARGAK